MKLIIILFSVILLAGFVRAGEPDPLALDPAIVSKIPQYRIEQASYINLTAGDDYFQGKGYFSQPRLYSKQNHFANLYYEEADKLCLELEENTLVNLGGDDVYIPHDNSLQTSDVPSFSKLLDKYETWRITSSKEKLADGISKFLGNIGNIQLVFTTPDILQIGNYKVTESQVSEIKHLLSQLPKLHDDVMARIKKDIADEAADEAKTKDADRKQAEAEHKKAEEQERANSLLK
jgi:hypothetical protein